MGDKSGKPINGRKGFVNAACFTIINYIIATQTGETLVSMRYNGEGLRAEKTVNGAVTRYLYEYDKVVLELDGSGNQTGRNVYGTNLLMRTADGTTYYYMYNGHGDVTALLGTDGTVKGTYYYDPFGNILEHTGTDSNVTFSGYQYDKETGLYYCNSRMYDPKIARFLQQDTYSGNPSDPLSLNMYTYCNNNPLIYVDPTGHWPEWLDNLVDKGKKKLGQAKDAVVDTVSSGYNYVSEKVSDAASWTMDNVVEPTANFVGGVAVSGVKDLVVQPAIDAGYVVDRVLGSESLAKSNYISRTQTVEKLEQKIVDNLVTNQTAYYAGRFVGDVGSTAFGVYQTVQAIPVIATGITTFGAGLAATPETGPIGLGASAIGVGITAAGVAEAGYGLSASYHGFNNARTNFAKMKQAWSSSKQPIDLDDLARTTGKSYPELINKNLGKRVKINDTEVELPSKPHKNGTEGHWEAIVDDVVDSAQSGDYTKIYANKGLSKEVSLQGIEPNRRPDVMKVRKDGMIDQVEVPSKTDDVFDLMDRMKDNQRILGDRAGDTKIIYPKR